jgi:hypothetical protein
MYLDEFGFVHPAYLQIKRCEDFVVSIFDRHFVYHAKDKTIQAMRSKYFEEENKEKVINGMRYVSKKVDSLKVFRYERTLKKYIETLQEALSYQMSFVETLLEPSPCKFS